MDEHNHDRHRKDQYLEETSTDLADEFFADEDAELNDDETMSMIFGWSGIVLSVVSFFLLPVILAGAGIILGFIARARAAYTLGNIAIGIAVISLILRFFIQM